MEEKSYRKLVEPWKNMFDLCAATKSDHLDLNEFKLFYNQKLLEAFLEDQASNKKRGLSYYGELTEKIYFEAEKQFYERKDNHMSFTSVRDSILSSDYVNFDYMKDDGGKKYPHIIIKLVVSTITLSESEKTFISSHINAKLDDESSSLSLAVATLPKMKKLINHNIMEEWAKQTVIKHLYNSSSVGNREEIKPTWKEEARYVGLNLYARYLI
tara:strand:+ start:2094 stop:2732 length:639 start_codon:yes stop_codon:yes gene_type:complete